MFTPLSLPKEVKEEPKVPNTLGVRNDIFRNEEKEIKDGSPYISLQVVGVKDVPNNTYYIKYLSTTILELLYRVKLQFLFRKVGIWDLNNLENGKCRRHYVVTENSRLYASPVSPMSHLQRGSTSKPTGKVEEIKIL